MLPFCWLPHGSFCHAHGLFCLHVHCCHTGVCRRTFCHYGSVGLYTVPTATAVAFGWLRLLFTATLPQFAVYGYTHCGSRLHTFWFCLPVVRGWLPVPVYCGYRFTTVTPVYVYRRCRVGCYGSSTTALWFTGCRVLVGLFTYTHCLRLYRILLRLFVGYLRLHVTVLLIYLTTTFWFTWITVPLPYLCHLPVTLGLHAPAAHSTATLQFVAGYTRILPVTAAPPRCCYCCSVRGSCSTRFYRIRHTTCRVVYRSPFAWLVAVPRYYGCIGLHWFTHHVLPTFTHTAAVYHTTAYWFGLPCHSPGLRCYGYVHCPARLCPYHSSRSAVTAHPVLPHTPPQPLRFFLFFVACGLLRFVHATPFTHGSGCCTAHVLTGSAAVPFCTTRHTFGLFYVVYAHGSAGLPPAHARFAFTRCGCVTRSARIAVRYRSWFLPGCRLPVYYHCLPRFTCLVTRFAVHTAILRPPPLVHDFISCLYGWLLLHGLRTLPRLPRLRTPFAAHALVRARRCTFAPFLPFTGSAGYGSAVAVRSHHGSAFRSAGCTRMQFGYLTLRTIHGSCVQFRLLTHSAAYVLLRITQHSTFGLRTALLARFAVLPYRLRIAGSYTRVCHCVHRFGCTALRSALFTIHTYTRTVLPRGFTFYPGLPPLHLHVPCLTHYRAPAYGLVATFPGSTLLPAVRVLPCLPLHGACRCVGYTPLHARFWLRTFRLLLRLPFCRSGSFYRYAHRTARFTAVARFCTTLLPVRLPVYYTLPFAVTFVPAARLYWTCTVGFGYVVRLPHLHAPRLPFVRCRLRLRLGSVAAHTRLFFGCRALHIWLLRSLPFWLRVHARVLYCHGYAVTCGYSRSRLPHCLRCAHARSRFVTRFTRTTATCGWFCYAGLVYHSLHHACQRHGSTWFAVRYYIYIPSFTVLPLLPSLHAVRFHRLVGLHSLV